MLTLLLLLYPRCGLTLLLLWRGVKWTATESSSKGVSVLFHHRARVGGYHVIVDSFRRGDGGREVGGGGGRVGVIVFLRITALSC